VSAEIDTSKVAVKPACPKPCSSCPWRLANQGSKPDPHKFYTKANLARLWRGLRDGARMSCHPTDPRISEFAGYEALADREDTHECAGALTLQQRELVEFQDMAAADPKGPTMKTYRKLRSKGLTRNGLVAIFERAMFNGTGLAGTKMSTPDLNDQEIGYDVLGVWKARKAP
jgi:hypothetical protein